MMVSPSYEQVIHQARERLAEAGVWDVVGDVNALVDRFLTRAEPSAAVVEFQQAIAERGARIPLGHITGSVIFDGLPLVVGSGVFVPRAESVALVEWATDTEVLPQGGRVLDVCSGVGALGIAVSRRRPDVAVVCVERDDTAVQYLRRNVARQAHVTGQVEIDVADLLSPNCLAAYEGEVNLIMANPPYVAPHVRLLPEWSEHQPKAAIYSGEDGLDLIRRITTLAADVLCPGGWLAFEHDRAQPAAVRQILVARGFSDVSTFADSAGESRVTVARNADHKPTS
jgi:release factor glutamine methyltransferase